MMTRPRRLGQTDTAVPDSAGQGVTLAPDGTILGPADAPLEEITVTPPSSAGIPTWLIVAIGIALYLWTSDQPRQVKRLPNPRRRKRRR